MAKIQAFTKDGIIEIDVVTPQEKLKKDVDKAVSVDEKINKIMEYLGAV